MNRNDLVRKILLNYLTLSSALIFASGCSDLNFLGGSESNSSKEGRIDEQGEGVGGYLTDLSSIAFDFDQETLVMKITGPEGTIVDFDDQTLLSVVQVSRESLDKVPKSAKVTIPIGSTLGETNIESDGSFMIEVTLETLDPLILTLALESNLVRIFASTDKPSTILKDPLSQEGAKAITSGDFVDADGLPLTGRFTRLVGDNGITCGITRFGQPYCWGEPESGVGLGVGDVDVQEVPAPVDLSEVSGSKAAIKIDSYNRSTIMLMSDGMVYTWGLNGHGQGGRTDGAIAYIAKPVAGLPEKGIDVAVGHQFSCVLTITKKVYCFGNNGSGKIGQPAIGSSDEPLIVDTSSIEGAPKSIHLGYRHACVLTDSDKVYCWGGNDFGQISGSSDESYLPVKVGFTNDVSIKDISMGGHTSCAIDVNAKLWCWGRVQTTLDGEARTTPVEILGADGALEWETISVGQIHTCGLNTSGLGFCFGADNNGAFGNDLVLEDNSSQIALPVSMPNDETLSSIGAGRAFTHAIDEQGHLFFFGNNQKYQFGIEPLGKYKIPHKVDFSSVFE